ncbi:acyltransferase-domain-containing protein [Chytriomyces sp. MP71]|nr:acyltransferase-domain-containing protein [Chytriomyces sp. MP71]
MGDTEDDELDHPDSHVFEDGTMAVVRERESTDVTTGVKFNRFRSDPLGFFIRLTAESSAFVSGDGWQGYNNPIGTPIFYPEYSSEIKEALVSSSRLKDAVRSLANKKVSSVEAEKKDPKPVSAASESRRIKRAEGEVWKQANTIIDGMIANLDSMSELKFLAFTIHYVLVRMYHQGIHIREREFLELKKTAEYAEKNKLSLIFLPCHKSHIDYLVISYIFYRLGLALPHIAAGDNLNMPVVGHLLKHCGAFFIRRVWGDDLLYNTIMREYIEILLRKGHNIEAFTEGTRSRIGKLLQPKFGIMKIIMESVLSGRVNDCIIVPMSIGYDKVIETGSYVSELLGAPKEKESLYQLLSNMNILSFKWGRIDISFAKPFSMREYIASQTLRRGVILNPSTSVEDRNLMLQSLGFRVLSDINKVSVIMPTALVGTVLLTLRGRGVGRNELIRKVNWLRRVVTLRGGAVADFGGQTTGWIVDRAVQVLRDLVGQRSDLLEPVFYPAKRFELSFYRNQVIHLFITEAILSCALYATVKQGGPIHVQKVRIVPDLESDCTFLSRLLKTEFIYGPNGLSQNMMKTIEAMKTLDVITIEEEVNEVGAPTGQQWVSLSAEERRIGRETFDFFCFLLWPFLETYWLAAISCFSLIPPNRNSTEPFWVEERTFLNTSQFLGKTLYYEGDLSYFEAVNKETIKNACQRLKDMGVLKYSKMKRGNDSVTMVSLSASWLPAKPLPDAPCMNESDGFTQDPLKSRRGRGFLSSIFGPGSAPPAPVPLTSLDGSSEPEETFDSWHYFMPEGKLWELCEQMSRYRREGKNRRDTATVATRVLRLAAVAKDEIIKASTTGRKLRSAKL